jgi:CoA transferase family III
MNHLPLAGLTVVSLEQAVAAPFATRQLADLGARVIKVERPGGDFARGYDRTVHGQSSYFVWLNRGKESVVFDVKDPGDRALLGTMISRADVNAAEPHPRCGGAARPGRRGVACGPAVADPLLDLRVRRVRTLFREEGLRPADSVRDGTRLVDRDARCAVEGGLLRR